MRIIENGLNYIVTEDRLEDLVMFFLIFISFQC